MSVLGIDLGGTKLAASVFADNGRLISEEKAALGGRKGTEVGGLISATISKLLKSNMNDDPVISVGISVPGISLKEKGTVWAPNIPGWIDYPLLSEVTAVAANIPVIIESDRACCVMGEMWQGNARGCRDVIFMAVGTGIGAGIVVNGEILRGSHDIAGATGWMALNRPFEDKYTGCGCFEYHASGGGIAKVACELLRTRSDYAGELRSMDPERITSYDVFSALGKGDAIATEVIDQCVGFWGMAAANFVSLFNPEIIIFGGGIFGPARNLIPAIMSEATKWAQPVSLKQVRFCPTAFEGSAAVYGAGYLALKNLVEPDKTRQP